MPWFHRRSDEEKQQQADADSERAATIAALEQGSIPVPARRRLEELRGGDRPLFTSDLSVSEFLLSRAAGIRPITQVMGSSVYHVGWQYLNSWSSSGELAVISQALNQARSLALGRMTQEATLAGANVVVGVRIERQPIGDERLLEFQAFGTAAHLEGAPATDTPGLTNLSGQDFWKLYQAGYWPLGVVAGSTVYHAVPSWGSQWAMSGIGGWMNQELTDFTAGLYAARHLAMSRVYGEADRHLHAAGVVGVTLEQTEEEYEVRTNNQERTDMIFTFHVLGTAIAELERSGKGTAVRSAVSLRP